MKPLFHQVSIVGLGLIGGSLGLALRKGRVARRVIGFSRREATIHQAIARGAIHDGDTELCPNWLGDSDLVVIATPPLAVAATARKIAKITPGRILLTDVASTKSKLAKELQRTLPSRISFVGGHPMAGSEQSGLGAAEAGLFAGSVCILTPTGRPDLKGLARVEALWRRIGMLVVRMSPERHDVLVAQISHLPHLSAAALALTPDSAALPLAAGGFADATRIALSDPALWEEICRTNRTPILRSLDRYLRELKKLRALVARQDSAPLRRRLESARRARSRIRR